MSAAETEIPVRLVQLYLCDPCLDGEGGECHTPGCSLWITRAPDLAIRDRPGVQVIDDAEAEAALAEYERNLDGYRACIAALEEERDRAREHLAHEADFLDRLNKEWRELVREILREVELGTLGQHTAAATSRTLARTAEWRKRAGIEVRS